MEAFVVNGHISVTGRPWVTTRVAWVRAQL